MLDSSQTTAAGVAEKATFEVADVFRLYGKTYRNTHRLLLEHRKVMDAIERCRTSALGGHVHRCDQCDYEHSFYNSCRDRHCPKCQTMAKEKWLSNRKAELLPVSYFHVVFTLPHELNPLILCNKFLMLDILFAAVNDTLKAFAKDPQWRVEGRLGFIAVLHTWSQTLIDHFHLHLLIPAGVIDNQGQFKPLRESFLFRNDSMAKLFCKRYVKRLQRAYNKDHIQWYGQTQKFKDPKSFKELICACQEKEWIIYTKEPFDGPIQVLKYLGRYTHRVAICNNRIVSIDKGKVIFTYKDRKHDNAIRTLPLNADEFIRRFLLHVLPDGFMKIRYFGFLSSCIKRKSITLIRSQLGIDESFRPPLKESVQEMMLRLTGIDIRKCPRCKTGNLVLVATLSSTKLGQSNRGPPADPKLVL